MSKAQYLLKKVSHLSTIKKSNHHHLPATTALEKECNANVPMSPFKRQRTDTPLSSALKSLHNRSSLAGLTEIFDEIDHIEGNSLFPVIEWHDDSSTSDSLSVESFAHHLLIPTTDAFRTQGRLARSPTVPQSLHELDTADDTAPQAESEHIAGESFHFPAFVSCTHFDLRP
jgi:hypothetical protein